MNSTELEFVVHLESRVWEALVSGDARVDESLLADRVPGVYSTGIAGRDEHVGQLASGPTVKSYAVSNARVMHLCPNTVVLSYLAVWSRPGSESPARLERMYISSIWQQQHGVWRNVFSQDTKADG